MAVETLSLRGRYWCGDPGRGGAVRGASTEVAISRCGRREINSKAGSHVGLSTLLCGHGTQDSVSEKHFSPLSYNAVHWSPLIESVFPIKKEVHVAYISFGCQAQERDII